MKKHRILRIPSIKMSLLPINPIQTVCPAFPVAKWYAGHAWMTPLSATVVAGPIARDGYTRVEPPDYITS